MGRNLTIYLSDKVGKRMDEFKEVNWSQVCRAAIEKYVEDRYNINPKARARFLQLENEERSEGRTFGSRVAEELADTMTYDQVLSLLREIDGRTRLGFSEDEVIEMWISPPYEGMDAILAERFKKQAAIKGSLPWLLKTYEGKEEFRKNPTFVEGMLEAIKEVFK